MQEFPVISTDPRDRNIQLPLTTIDVSSEEVNSLLHPLLSIALDLNKLPTQVLVQLQQVAGQELADRHKELSNGYVQSQDKTNKLQEEVDELWQVKGQLMEEKAQDISTLKRA